MHAIDEAWEELRFIGAIVVVFFVKSFKGNRELNVARTDNVLYLKFLKLHAWVSVLLNHLCIGFCSSV